MVSIIFLVVLIFLFSFWKFVSLFPYFSFQKSCMVLFIEGFFSTILFEMGTISLVCVEIWLHLTKFLSITIRNTGYVIYTAECYSAIKKMKSVISTTWMTLEIIMLSEMNQTQMCAAVVHKYHTTFGMWKNWSHRSWEWNGGYQRLGREGRKEWRKVG